MCIIVKNRHVTIAFGAYFSYYLKMNNNHHNSNPSGLMPFIYGLTVFSGAFLLFQVQPLMGKFILPWFGGSPEVWTTCMLFFQVFLLVGYAYAHFSVSHLCRRAQAIVHIVLMIAALVALPVIPSIELKPQPGGIAMLQVMTILSLCVGLPYFVLSATGPLIQGWLAQVRPGVSPWRLYSLSNAGSLIALISFPFIAEPMLTRQMIAKIWGWGLIAFVVFCSACAWLLWRTKNETSGPADIKGSGKINIGTRLLWFALPAAASVELLAVTNKICQDIAVFPFLWILPLCLYLLSFIICFHHERWYVRPIFLALFILSIVGVIVARQYEADLNAVQLIALYSAMLFCACVVCHGELYRIRPHAKKLTGYYLSISAGGALGGFFVAVISPLIFNAYSELYVGLLACVLFALLADKSKAMGTGKRKWVWVTLIIVVGSVGSFMQGRRTVENQRAIANSRNFFGVLTIYEGDWKEPDKHKYLMQHGTTFHGLQFVDPARRLAPTAYYSEDSGVGVAINALAGRGKLNVGIVGLGVGTIATYGREGDSYRYYEINPEVERLAREHFSYLENCKADLDVVLGDARLSMENEPPQNFDLLVMDAFSSDAVPLHLLTTEAFEIYLKHIKDDGVIAFHISSIHLDLDMVVFKLAEHFDLRTAWIMSDENDDEGVLASDWILLTKNEGFINSRKIKRSATDKPDDYKEIGLWTDDHTNLFEIFK